MDNISKQDVMKIVGVAAIIVVCLVVVVRMYMDS